MSERNLDREALVALGFSGFLTFEHLRSTGLAGVPTTEGVYVVVRESLEPPRFRETSIGGWFKGKDPTVPVATLEAKWVPGACLVYVGRATSGRSGTRRLRKRLNEYARFGSGANVGHQGGRSIWQLADSGTLLVAWRSSVAPGTPVLDERELVTRFAGIYGGRLPFANLVTP